LLKVDYLKLEKTNDAMALKAIQVAKEEEDGR
jgi:hypothetical protein